MRAAQRLAASPRAQRAQAACRAGHFPRGRCHGTALAESRPREGDRHVHAPPLPPALGRARSCRRPDAAGRGRRADDTALFSAAVPPNVLLVIDSSALDEHRRLAPGLRSGAAVSCNCCDLRYYARASIRTSAFDPTQTYTRWATSSTTSTSAARSTNGGPTRTACGKTRNISTDQNASPDAARREHEYTRCGRQVPELATTAPRSDPVLPRRSPRIDQRHQRRLAAASAAAPSAATGARA